ncbi:MAG: T9SS type A sorting domain-containing protein [Dyadobacter fermentans]
MKFFTRFLIMCLIIAVSHIDARSQAIVIDFDNKSVSSDGLSWTFDLIAKGSTASVPVYEGPNSDNWQAINLRLDFELPAGVTILGGSGIGNPLSTTGQVGVQLQVPGTPVPGKSELGLTIARSAPPGQPGQQDINTNDFTTLATFTINFSGQVFQATKLYPRISLNKEGSTWTNVADSKRRPIFIGGFAGSTMGTITLPVKLVNFDANKENGRVQLTWATSEEIDADYFEVQKSADGKTWKTISRIDANGGEKQVTNYLSVDESPFAGTNLYRLHMVDLDGSGAFSVIRSLVFENAAVALYPNPAHGVLHVMTPQNAKADMIELTDLQGRVVYSGKETAIDTSLFPIGKYIITVILDNGSINRREVVITR